MKRKKGREDPADGVSGSWGTYVPELHGVMGIPQPHSCVCSALCCSLFHGNVFISCSFIFLEKCCPTFVCPHLTPCSALVQCVITNKPNLLCFYKSKGVLFEHYDSAGSIPNLSAFSISLNKFRLILIQFSFVYFISVVIG